jgi:large subunit ribosomal protein L17
MIANMLKSLVTNERIQTTVAKAKELRRHADKLITMAKEDSLFGRRKAIAALMVSYNTLTTKEARAAKAGDTSAYNDDRKVIDKLFAISKRFIHRNGGYTRIIRSKTRIGDNAPICYIEYLPQERNG